MSPESNPSLLAELARVKSLQEEFRVAQKALDTVAGPEAYREALEIAKLKEQEASAGILALQEKLNPFENEIHLKDQYEAQVALLSKSNLLKDLPNGQKGIMALDTSGNPTVECPIPTREEINEHLINQEKKETFKKKIEQGFVKLLIVPFGLPLSEITETYKTALKTHFDQKKLFYTKKEPTDKDEPITELHKDGPMWIWDKYQNADATGELVYEPKELSQTNHQGKTKSEIVAQKGGWQVLLIEDMPNIPREGQVQEKGGRRQIDTKGETIKKYIAAGNDAPSPKEYLKALQTESQNQTSPYYQEQPMNPETQLIYALTHLQETNEVIDDYRGKGSISYQLGAYFPLSGNIPNAYWDRDARQFNLNRNDPGIRVVACGVRSLVRV